MWRASVNAENRCKYDKNIAESKSIKNLGVNLSVSYQRTFKILTVSPRDVYQNCFYNVNEDSSIIITTYDNEREFEI